MKFLIPFLITAITASGCVYVAGPTWGTVVDYDSGLPIRDVVVVRSWDDRYFSPGGEADSTHTVSEKATSANGRYAFYPRLFLYSPLMLASFRLMKENDMIVYKPGYELFVSSEGRVPDPIPLRKVGDSYFMRHDAHEEARKNYMVDKTRLLCDALSLEEDIIEHIDRHEDGIFYQPAANVGDIDFDAEGNVYVTTNGYLEKLSSNGIRLKVGSEGFVHISSEYPPPDIEFGDGKDIYVLGRNSFMKVAINTAGESIEKTPNLIDYGIVPVDEVAASKKGMRSSQKQYKAVSVGRRGGKKDSEEYVQLIDRYRLPRYTSMRFAISPRKSVFVLPMPYPPSPAWGTVQVFHLDSNGTCGLDIGKAINGAPGAVRINDITADGEDSALISSAFYGSHRSGFLRIDSRCQVLASKVLDLASPIVSVAALPSGRVLAATKESLLVLTADFDVESTKDLRGSRLGGIEISRIKATRNGDSVYLIDAAFPRILRYDLKEKQWFKKKHEVSR
jgi:hypothetical protein